MQHNKFNTDTNDIIGKTFGELYVESYAGYINGKSYYNCSCSCGKKCKVLRNQLLTGQTRSCGHLVTQLKDDLTNQRFGRLVALELFNIRQKNGKNLQMYKCKCDCGNFINVRRRSLVGGRTRSCGCLLEESRHKIKHGLTKTRFYSIWHHIKGRCLNPNDDGYPIYGGRGISVCDEWLDFENFKNDMYDEYVEKSNIYGEENISIDRINTNGNYCKENCRWATQKQQCNNVRDNTMVLCNGIQMTLMEAYYKYAIPGLLYGTVRDRVIGYNWPLYEALTTPLNTKYSHPTNTHPIRAIYFELDSASLLGKRDIL